MAGHAARDAGAVPSDLRRGRNIRHLLTGLVRRSIYARLAGYTVVNHAERLSLYPKMWAIVDRQGIDRLAAPSTQMGRFETAWSAKVENLDVLSNLSGLWIDRVHGGEPPKVIVLDKDHSESPTYGGQEGSVYSGHFGRASSDKSSFEDLRRYRLHPVSPGAGTPTVTKAGILREARGWDDLSDHVPVTVVLGM